MVCIIILIRIAARLLRMLIVGITNGLEAEKNTVYDDRVSQ